VTLLGVNLAPSHWLIKAHRIAMKSRERFDRRPITDRPGERLIYAKSDVAGELYVYQQIGATYFGDGLTGDSVRQALDAMKGVKALNVYINSEGGDVFEAKAIFSQLQRFEAAKTVYIDGIAASAATFIAMAGDTIVNSPVATWMVHNPWTVAVGSADEMRKTADVLDLEAKTLAETYAKKTGASVEDMLALMSTETWMGAQDAVAQGFADKVSDPDNDDDENGDDDEDGDGQKNATTRLIAAAYHTERIIKSLTPADRMSARVVASSQMRLKNSAGQPANPRTPASR
jgi:ATP-dependent Clp protease protease subunit